MLLWIIKLLIETYNHKVVIPRQFLLDLYLHILASELITPQNFTTLKLIFNIIHSEVTIFT